MCGFCKSTLARDANTLALIGKQGELLEDYSRLQIGTGGKVNLNQQSRAFSLIGRIQLRFNTGYWNEWYVLYDDGLTAWLSDASGQYVLSQAIESTAAIPTFDSISIGQTINLAGEVFTASDKRVSECIGGRGELPFAPSSTWQARTIDLRSAAQFVTLDYSDAVPMAYQGFAVAFEDLHLSHLRDTKDRFTGEVVAGQLPKSTVTSLNCASCASPITLVLGQTAHLICPSCGSSLREQNSGLIVEIERSNVARAATSLQPGDTGKLNGTQWTVLGVLVRQEKSDPSSTWEEYLLFEPTQGFIWLSNVQGAWSIVEVLNEVPKLSPANATIGAQIYNRTFQYTAITSYAAGSFNWKPQVGDAVLVTEYKLGQRSLASEQTESELTWSRGKPVSTSVVLRAFGKLAKVATKPEQRKSSLLVPTLIASCALALAVGPAYFIPSLGTNPVGTFFALLVLWAPYILSNTNFKQSNKDSDSDLGD